MTDYKYWPTVTKKEKIEYFTVMFRLKLVFLVLVLKETKLGLY